MKSISLKDKAQINILKFSVICSTLLLLFIILTAFTSYQVAQKASIKKELFSLGNRFSQETLSHNYPAFLEKFQQRSNVREIVILNENCEILATTSLINIKDCHSLPNSFEVHKLKMNSQNIIVLYRSEISPLAYLKTNYKIIALLYLAINIIIVAILKSFFYITFTSPMNKIKSLINNDTIVLPSELFFLEEKLIDLSNQIRIIESEKQYFNIAKRVMHDIRNPLLYIKSTINNNLSSPEEIVDRINEIEFHIQSLLKSKSVNRFQTIDIKKTLNEFSKEVSEIFHTTIHIDIQSPASISSKIHPFELKNMLLNLARNSFEAGATQIDLSATLLNSEFTILLSDNGSGIPYNIIETIFESGKTSKVEGHGIGLKSINDFLIALNGSIRIEKNSSSGVVFEMRFPVNNIKAVVFIDNDKFMHIAWKREAEKLNTKVHTFFSVKEFIEGFDHTNYAIPIYIDSNLDEEDSGEIQAKHIYEIGYREIYLATSYSEVDLANTPWVKSVVPKMGPFL